MEDESTSENEKEAAQSGDEVGFSWSVSARVERPHNIYRALLETLLRY